MKKRTVEIILERDEVFILPAPAATLRGWCDACGAEAEFASPDAAAVLLHTTTRALYRLVEAAAVHFIESPDGLLLICLRSIERQK